MTIRKVNEKMIDPSLVQKVNDHTSQLADIAISVKSYGAVGNGVDDDTTAIQRAIDFVESVGGGTVIIPDGTYMIRANVPNTTTANYLRDEGGIALKDNVKLSLTPNTILKAFPTSQKQYQIIRSYGRKNIAITGGTILGERNDHTGTTGEWGYGIAIHGGENIKIDGVIVKDCWGDGINLQFIDTTTDIPKNVIIQNVKCLNNRRQGMSVEGCINGTVRDSQFSYTNGIAPNCGVDVEPWSSNSKVENLIFENCIFEHNSSSGLLVMGAMISDVTISNCRFSGNKDSEAQFKTFYGATNILVRDSYFEKNGGSGTGILFQNGSALRAYKNEMKDCMIYMRISGTTAAFLDDVIIEGNVLKCKELSTYEIIQIPSAVTKLRIVNNTFDFSGNDLGERYFILKGTATEFSGNKLLNVKRGLIIESVRAKVFENEIHGSALEGSYINAQNVMFYKNLISGACHGNNSAPTVRLSNLASGSIVLENTMLQESLISISGTGKSGVGIDINTTLTNLIVRDNVTKALDKSTTYHVTTGVPTSADNHIEKGTIPTGVTANRPLRAYQGDPYFDTTLNKPIWCKTRVIIDAAGTVTTPAVWVDSAGTVV